MATYPDVNGIRYDWTSIEISLLGGVKLGFKSIDYSQALEPGEVRTNHQSGVVGRTRGQQKPEASFEIHKVELDALITQMGPGYMEIAFDITVSYADTNQPTITDKLFGCRIKKIAMSPKEGNEAPTAKVDLHVLSVNLSNTPATTDGLFT